MINSSHILKIHKDSFSGNIYTVKPFRMIGLIDVDIEYYYGIEKVTLAFYSSSGSNSGKIKGLWYPIVGIKTHTGEFTEFTPYLNFILKNTSRNNYVRKGWLAKSLFFNSKYINSSKIRGFSNGKHYESLLDIGTTLRSLYEQDSFNNLKSLDAYNLNKLLTSNLTYPGNIYTQRENFERFIQDIFNQV